MDSFSVLLSLTNLVVEVHFEDCSEADWGKGNDAVFDPDAVCLERDEEADLGPGCLVEVALGELEHGEEDDADNSEDREEKPVELVEKLKVWPAFGNKTSFSISDQKSPEEEIHA